LGQKKVYTGFVVGSDIVNGEKEVWKVRVSDGSELDKLKFEVATTHVLLAKGLEVNFSIGSVLVGKKQVRKAVEVTAKS
jgi:hypothetical protein